MVDGLRRTRLLAAPLWAQSVSSSIQSLVCDDSGGFDIEISLKSNFVVGSATGRVWVYGRNKRVQSVDNTPTYLNAPPADIFNRLNTSQHEKRLLHDPTQHASLNSPSAKSISRHQQRAIRRRWPTLTRSVARTAQTGTFFYLGNVAHGKRHGWGRLASNQRTLYDGGWHENACRGFYLAHHEFYTEVGLQCPWFRVGVLILRDSANSIIPIALDRPLPGRPAALHRSEFSEDCESSAVSSSEDEACQFRSETESLAAERRVARRLSDSTHARVSARPHGLTGLAVRSTKTVHDPDCISLARHRRTVTDFHRFGIISAATLSRWSCQQVQLFLVALGAYEAVGPFKRKRIAGAQVQTLNEEKLRRLGVRDPNCRRIVLVAFRHLWGGLIDPLATHTTNPMPDLNSHTVNVQRKIGSGGHALVYLGTISPNIGQAALKIFTDTRKPRSARIPSTNRPLKFRSAELRATADLRATAELRATADRRSIDLRVTNDRRSIDLRSADLKSADLTSADSSLGPEKTDSTLPELVLSKPDFSGIREEEDVWRGCGLTGGLMAFSLAGVLSSLKEWLTSPAPLPEIKVAAAPQTEPRGVSVRAQKRTAALRMRDYEVAVMSSIPKHPHVIQALGHFILPGDLPGIAVEFCSQGALDTQVLQERSPVAAGGYRGRYTWTQLIAIFRHIAEGMAHVHESGFLHRDLKPSNFLITDDYIGKVSDFGVSKSFRVGRPHPFFLAAYGNIYYAAPEVLRGEGCWPESDVYSYGVSFWEALSGRAVHEGLSRGQIFCRVSTGRVSFPPPPLLCPGLAALLARMVAFDRRERPSFRQIAAYIAQLNHINASDALSKVQALMLGG